MTSSMMLVPLPIIGMGVPAAVPVPEHAQEDKRDQHYVGQRTNDMRAMIGDEENGYRNSRCDQQPIANETAIRIRRT